MVILGIETSCDDTAIAIIEIGKLKKKSAPIEIAVLADITRSQAKLHEKFGGVFPNLAKREHQKNLVPILQAALSDADFLNFSPSNEPKLKKNHSNILKNVGMILGREPKLLGQFLKFALTVKKPPIDLIAVTEGPGLEPCLWVGLNFAKALSRLWSVPVMPINHMEGHIFSALLEAEKIAGGRRLNADKRGKNTNYILQTPLFPTLALLISGGHTELVLMRDWFQYEIIGRTRDDAVGEAFDKVARILGLPYPGGPQISALAEISRMNADNKTRMDADEDRKKFSSSAIRALPLRSSALAERRGAHPRHNQRASTFQLPRPMLKSDNFDFSFSGLKTAVLYTVKSLEQKENSSSHPRASAFSIRDNPRLQKVIAREFENAVTEVLTEKTRRAIGLHGAKTLILGGGVVANTHIRRAFEALAKEKEIKLFIPAVEHSTDNALMIALAGGVRRIIKNSSVETSIDTLTAKGNKRLDEK